MLIVPQRDNALCDFMDDDALEKLYFSNKINTSLQLHIVLSILSHFNRASRCPLL